MSLGASRCWTRCSQGNSYNGVVRAGSRQDDERITRLEAENVVLRAERDEVSADNARLRDEQAELSAKLEAALAKIAELTKQVFGPRSERTKKRPDIIDANAWPAGDPEPGGPSPLRNLA